MFHIMIENIKATIFFSPEILHEMRHDHRAAVAPGSASAPARRCVNTDPAPTAPPPFAAATAFFPESGPRPPGRMRHLAAAAAGRTLRRGGLGARMRPAPIGLGRRSCNPGAASRIILWGAASENWVSDGTLRDRPRRLRCDGHCPRDGAKARALPTRSSWRGSGRPETRVWAGRLRKLGPRPREQAGNFGQQGVFPCLGTENQNKSFRARKGGNAQCVVCESGAAGSQPAGTGRGRDATRPATGAGRSLRTLYLVEEETSATRLGLMEALTPLPCLLSSGGLKCIVTRCTSLLPGMRVAKEKLL